MRYDKNNDPYDLVYDEAAGLFATEQREYYEREQQLKGVQA